MTSNELEDKLEEQDRNSDTADLKTWLGGMAIGVVVLAIIVATYAFGFSQGKEHAPKVAVKPAAGATAATPAKQPNNAAALIAGKKLFASAGCGSCHTLAAAGTSGTVGPNLDNLKPTDTVVADALKNGGAGSGTMPKNLATGADAQALATYVSSVAGK